jgi:DNA-binding response OmpR family regulator
MKRVLIIDDDAGFCKIISDYFTAEGFDVASTGDGMEAFRQILAAAPDEFDLILLDVELPGLDGFEVLKRIRTRRNTPVIMLTGRIRKSDPITGLESGADDFLVKPCSPRELLARVRAVLRRAGNNLNNRESGTEPPERINVGDIELDFETRVVRRNGEELRLTSFEFSFLEMLLRVADRIVTRKQLAQGSVPVGFDSNDLSKPNSAKISQRTPSTEERIAKTSGVVSPEELTQIFDGLNETIGG